MQINTREKLVKIAFNLFMHKSYKEVTIKEIVEKAGVSQGAFFHYFKSKEQIFFEIMENTLSSANSIFNKLSQESLFQFYHDYLDYLLELIDNDFEDDSKIDINYFTFMLEALNLFPHFTGKFAELHDIELNAWKNIVHTARTRNEIKADLSDELIAKIFIYSLDGISMRGIHSRISGEKLKESCLSLWDDFYAVIKA